MNILNNISTDAIYLRRFTVPETDSPITEFVPIPVHRYYGTDPQFIQYGPFQNGYNIEFTISSSADLREIAKNNELVEVLFKTGDETYLQLGGKEGFRITGITPPPAPDKDLYTYQLKTDKPNSQPFKIR